MERITKKYKNGKITIDAAGFGIEQSALDCEIFNNEAITAAVKKLWEYEERLAAVSNNGGEEGFHEKK